MERVKTISHYEPFSIDFLKLNLIIIFFFFFRNLQKSLSSSQTPIIPVESQEKK